MVVNRARAYDVVAHTQRKKEDGSSLSLSLSLCGIDSIGALGQWEATVCQVHPPAIGCTAK